MGYGRCAVPSCLSRPGDGKVFKYLPKDKSLLNAWLRAFPSWLDVDTNKENASRKIALCQDHFSPADLEPGAYGKMRLNSCAVPSIFVNPPNLSNPAPTASPRRALGDVTNNSNIIAHVKVTPKKAVRLFSSTPGRVLPVEEVGWEEESILNEATGLFEQVTKSEPQDHSSVLLCELSGILSPTTSEAQEWSMDSFMEQQSALENFADCLEESLSSQALLISELREENARKDMIIEEQRRMLEDLRAESGSFSLQCKSLMKAKQRATKKLTTFGANWLSASQIQRLTRKKRGGVKWSTEEIRIGLILKMKSGTSAYKDWVSRFPILPSVRSLQEAVQFIRFDVGRLDSMFDLLESLADKLPDREKDCQIVLDEMVIEPSLRYDHSLQRIVGEATLKGHSGIAKKALVFIIAGISRRWKVPVAIELTSEKGKDIDKKLNSTGYAYKEIVDDIAYRTEKCGLFVCSVTSDMGPDNLAFWKTCQVTTGKKGEVKSSFPNPVRKDEEVTILCDAVHLWKAIKTAMETNRTFQLPADVVEEEKELTSPIVDYGHIEELYEFESDKELRVAYALKKENLKCNKHFKKMNVGTTKSVLGHRTGVGLNRLAEEKKNDSYKTTAWFVILLNTFFALATCRHPGMAISKANPIAYQKAINLIKKIDYIFTNMTIGDKEAFKPVQRGMRILCAGYLRLIHYFLEKRGYKYVMLGRFTGDCIENTFSLIRLAQAIPHAAMVFQCLKVIGLAQFSEAVKGSSYDYDESSPLSNHDFLEEARKKAKERASQRYYNSLEELMENPIKVLSETDLTVVGEWERAVVYDMAGAVIAALLRSNQKVCDECVSAVKWQDQEKPHPASLITEMKEFTLLRGDDGNRDLQIFVSDAVFRGLLTAEITFRLYREAAVGFKSCDVKEYFVEQLMYVWNNASLPECHYIGRKILNTFLNARLKQYGQKLKEEMKSQQTLQRASKSAAMHQAADRMEIVHK